MLSDLQLTFRKSESWLIQATFSSRDEPLPPVSALTDSFHFPWFCLWLTHIFHHFSNGS